MNNMQLGTAEETTYGTPVTVDRFYEFLGGESLDRQQQVLMPQGLRKGLRHGLGPRRALTKRWGAGSVSMEVATTGFGRWFKHMLGDFTTSQVTTGVYTHTFTPGSLKGKSLTIQKGVEKTDETVQALTFHGCKIPSWELSVSVDGYLQLTVEVDAEDVEDDTALAAASIGTIKNFHFAHATISKDSTPIAGVSDASIRGTNALNVERWFLGTAGLKEEPLENGLRTLAGDLSAEFRDMATFYEAFEADTSMELVLAFVGDPIGSTTVTEGLTITLSDVRLTGEAPKVSGPEPAVQSVPFEAYEDASGSSITITYTTSDSAP